MWAEWCEACKKMDTTTFSDPTVIKQLIEKGYVIVTHFGEAKNIKKKAKEHNCQFYLNNNNIKSL